MNPTRDKLDFFKNKTLGSADAVRQALSDCENQLYALHERKPDVILAFMTQLSAIDDELIRLRDEDGLDISTEIVRIDAILHQFFAQEQKILASVERKAPLASLRPADYRAEDYPWWFIDERVSAQKQRFRRRAAWVLALGLCVILIGFILANTLLAPDPAVVQRITLTNTALSAITEEADYNAALAYVDEVLFTSPDSLETMVFKTLILNELNRPADADAVLAKAQSLSQDPLEIPLVYGRIYLQLNQAEKALPFAEDVVAQDDESAEAWLLLGQSQANLDNSAEAYIALTRAANLALDQGKDELYTIAKLNLAYLQPPGVEQE